jgi:hypothetical protein
MNCSSNQLFFTSINRIDGIKSEQKSHDIKNMIFLSISTLSKVVVSLVATE